MVKIANGKGNEKDETEIEYKWHTNAFLTDNKNERFVSPIESSFI